MTRDQQPASLSYLHSLVQDVFNLLEVRLLVRIEHQLLEVQSSQPAPNSAASPSHLCLSLPAPMRPAQVLGWRIPMGAGYQQQADAIFGAAADALIAPPMPAPHVLWPWEPPVDTTVLVDGPPVSQGAFAQHLATRTSATDDDLALSAISNALTREPFKVASTGQAVCAEHVTAADEAACEAAGAAEPMGAEAKGPWQIADAAQIPPPLSPSLGVR
jgi:hypothetical protein